MTSVHASHPSSSFHSHGIPLRLLLVPRLFVAIDLPIPIRTALTRLRFEAERARFVPESQIHLTLRFIGDAGDDVLERIRDGLRSVDGAPFTIALEGVGRFHPSRAANVLWVGLHPADRLIALAARVEDALSGLGLERECEKRPFSPHITIARLKSVAPAIVRRFLEENRSLSSDAFTVEAFHLYSSVLSAHGATHTILETYPLVTSPGEAKT